MVGWLVAGERGLGAGVTAGGFAADHGAKRGVLIHAGGAGGIGGGKAVVDGLGRIGHAAGWVGGKRRHALAGGQLDGAVADAGFEILYFRVGEFHVQQFVYTIELNE